MTASRLAPIVALLTLGSASLSAQQALRPAPSGRATTEVTLAIPRPPGTPEPAVAEKPLVIRLEYGQPHLRGRVLHTDSLVPYDKPWRMGANNPTRLTSDVELTLGGAVLPKGDYFLYTIPGRAGWKLVAQKNVGQQQPFDPANDMLRIDLRHSVLATPMEALTMWLIPSTGAGPAKGQLRFAWGADQLSTDWAIR